MIEYDSFIYLDVYRTGSSHVLGLLPFITQEKCVKAHRHAALTKAHPLGFVAGKRVFTTVRNPWDWYVSLWAYGCGGKSAIRRYLAAHLGERELASLYDRREPAPAFRRWLYLMHDPAILQQVMKEHLPQSGLAPAIGLYTYRFLRVTTRWPSVVLRRTLIANPVDALRHHQRFRAYHEVLRNESLDDDLAGFVRRNPKGFRPEAATIIGKASISRQNASDRTLAAYRDYYDDKSAGLIGTRDQFFSAAFGYRF